MNQSTQIRQNIIDTLQLDLIGPDNSDADLATEILPQPPSQWYLTGFLVPDGTPAQQKIDDDFNQELDETNRPVEDDTTPEKTSARPAYYASSMGLSFLVPPTADNINLIVEWGEYYPIEKIDNLTNQIDTEQTAIISKPTSLQETSIGEWQRVPHQEKLTIKLTKTNSKTNYHIPHTDGLEIVIIEKQISQRVKKLKPGTQTISVFLVNKKPPNDKRDISYIFQTKLTIQTNNYAIIGRPDMRTENLDIDEQINDLQYRNDHEYVVGHNVSAQAMITNGECHTIQTAWIPKAEVEKVIAANIPNVELSMEAIAHADSPTTLQTMLEPMITNYDQWIKQQYTQITDLSKDRQNIGQALLENASKINQRIAQGIKNLQDPQVFKAFQIANEAIAQAIRQRLTHNTNEEPQNVKAPKWRPFQLAFILMNISGISEPTHHERQIVDLLFFPTGGGKTEAYLGLAAFTIILRRLHNSSISKGMGGAGITVIMRYTLRLLTLDQLSRAATLICALELKRKKDPELLGKWPIEIGLWVGESATPNRLGSKKDDSEKTARYKVRKFSEDTKKPLPIPLDSCPWCGTKFGKYSFSLSPNRDHPRNLDIRCANRDCEFTGNEHLPIVAVDEPIYERLPNFLIATVDKFANLPWVGQTAALFGKVKYHDQYGFYSAADPGIGEPLDQELLPPDLIIQDELHLITGPLGTMVGLYETAIDHLCTRKINGKTITPKIIASTATVRQATKQIRALFARDSVDVFPPPGPNRRDSFFAQTVPIEEIPGRLYIGIAAQGRSLKVVLMRTYLALLSAAQTQWLAHQDQNNSDNSNNPADPYMTLLGYFNSLRELGGSRRIVEDEVKSKLSGYSQRQRIKGDIDPLKILSDRLIKDVPTELTSRVNTSQIAEAKRCLNISFNHSADTKQNKEQNKDRVDVALATNMISVGLDITRLGLMVVLGQPKSTSEYIQATSRVGRDDKKPGLVVTLFNIHRPRDRSHYERFSIWHQTFYRSVEATSVTPFSARALDRGLVGVTVALARLGEPLLTPAKGAYEIINYRQNLEFVADAISERVAKHDKDKTKQEIEDLAFQLKKQVQGLLDDWQSIAVNKQGDLQYQKEEDKAPPLLLNPLDPELAKKPSLEQKFTANRSLRDVEGVVSLWVETLDE